MTSKAKLESYGNMADAIGDLRSQIKVLQDRLKHTEGLLKCDSVEIAEGKNYRVAISYDVFRNTTNWKNIALRSNPSRQLVVANTTASVHDRVTVSAVLTH